ncbi:hypothetical protein Tco_0132127, partial [Tanacetum coccineum]
KFDEDLLAYCVENGIFKDFQDTSESSDDNTNVVNALREPCVVNQDPSVKSSQDPPQIDHNCPHYDYQCQPINETYYEPNSSYDSSGFDQPQPPQYSVDHQGILQVLNKMEEKFEEIIRDGRKKIEDMSIEEMMHEQQLVDREIKGIINDLGYKRFRVRKKEQAYEEEKYSAACRYMLSITCDDEDDYIPLAITTDLPIQEPNNSLNMGDEHLNTIPTTESYEVIKSSVENLVPIPSEFEGISNDTRDVPNCDNNYVNVESDFVESLINCDTSIVYFSKIDSIFEEFAGELAHIAPIPPGIVEADFDSNNDTSSDDDDFEDIEYVSLEEVNEVDQEEKEFDLEDVLQIQDVTLREKLLNVSRLISNIKSLKDNPIPIIDSDSSKTSLSFSDNSLPEFESFSDHTEETRSGSTTTHANYSLPVYDLFLFEIEPDQEELISINNSSNTLLELPEFESFNFDPSFSRPPPETPDVCMRFMPILVLKNVFVKPNEDFYLSETVLPLNDEEDDFFTFTICTFLLVYHLSRGITFDFLL